jgi:hypothetical protein
MTHDAPELQTREFEDFMRRFFRNILNSNGSWKTTRRSRHGTMDERLIRAIDTRGLRPKVVMDIGVASGVTTVDLMNSLKRAGHDVSMIATDRTIDGYVARLHPDLDVLVEPNGHVLKVELFGLEFSPWYSKSDYLSGLFVLKAILRRYVNWRVERSDARFPIGKESVPWSSKGLAVEGPFSMITPELKGRTDVVILEDDILAPPPPGMVGVADVVRLAHVIRPDRFSPDEIERIAVNVRSRCRDDALVLVCRSNPRQRVRESLEGSIFVATPDGGFALHERIGPGSEVERYFLGMVNKDAPRRHPPSGKMSQACE